MVGVRRARPVVLCIVDGFGEAPHQQDDPIALARTPQLDDLRERYPFTSLGASGPAVGLPEGQAGHGQIGHMTLGAGRVVQTERARIDRMIAGRKLGRNPAIVQTLRIAAERRCRLHLVGLVSDCTVHASMDHLYAMIELADFHEVPVVVHAVLDGRDMPPRSAMPLLDRLLLHLDDRGTIGTVSGRSHCLDAGDDWDRIYLVFQAIVRDKVLGPAAPHADTVFDAISQQYAQGRQDATVLPTRIGNYQGMVGDFLCEFGVANPVWQWTGEEVGLAFNHRPDGLWALSAMLTRQQLPAEVVDDLLMDRDKPVCAFPEHCLASLTEYDPGLHLPVAVEREPLTDTCGALVAEAGLSQVRIAETTKRAHVTEFFNGGRWEPFAGEQRCLVPSAPALDPAEPTPRPRTEQIVKTAVRGVTGGQYDFVVVNFSGPEALSCTGDRAGTVGAIEALDGALGRLADAVRSAGGALLVTSDHGRCDWTGEEAGDRAHAHTGARVPFLYVNDRDGAAELHHAGTLADVAPTVLQLLGIEPPASMSGRSLLRTTLSRP